MDNTLRVAQWRQRMRDAGKEALTVWLGRDAKRQLEDLAATWHTTPSAMIEQALAHFHPGSPPPIGNDTDTAQLQARMQDTVRAMLPGLKAQIVQELRGEMLITGTNGNVTVTEMQEPPAAPIPAPREALAPVETPQRTRGRPRSAVGQQILALLAQYPEGLTAEQMRVYLHVTKRLGDTLAGMKRLGTVQTRGQGKTLRYVLAPAATRQRSH